MAVHGACRGMRRIRQSLEDGGLTGRDDCPVSRSDKKMEDNRPFLFQSESGTLLSAIALRVLADTDLFGYQDYASFGRAARIAASVGFFSGQ
jgi:hypothetical protein